MGAVCPMASCTVKRIRGRKLQAIRAEHFSRNPLCVMCLEHDVVSVATELDHILPLSKGGTDTDDNRQCLCAPCHEIKTMADLGLKPRPVIGLDGFPTGEINRPRGPLWRLAERGAQELEFQELRMPSDLLPSRIPVTIVCGPPNGGKHPWVLEHAGVNDVVIELDKIMRDLSGLPVHEAGRKWLDQSLAERNRQLRALATDTKHERAWFIINAPDPKERALWAERLGATIVLLAPPLDECVRRINAEPYHEGYTERMIQAAKDWWAKNANLLRP